MRAWPVWLRFGLCLAAVIVALVEVEASRDLAAALAPLGEMTAAATARLLEAGGLTVVRSGAVLRHPAGFAVVVDWDCTGLVAAAVFLVGLLALPGRLRGKLAVAFAGCALIGAINLLRIASLVWVGAHHAAWFAFAHEVVWQLGVYVPVVLLWAIILRRTERPVAPRPSKGRRATGMPVRGFAPARDRA